jgi:hypothetical protein
MAKIDYANTEREHKTVSMNVSRSSVRAVDLIDIRPAFDGAFYIMEKTVLATKIADGGTTKLEVCK